MWILAVSALVKKPNLCLEACPGGLVDAFPTIFDFSGVEQFLPYVLLGNFSKASMETCQSMCIFHTACT
jgi:hypothetical protein